MSVDRVEVTQNDEEISEDWQLIPSAWRLAQEACMDGDICPLQDLLQGTTVMQDVRKLDHCREALKDHASLLSADMDALGFHMMLLKVSLCFSSQSKRHAMRRNRIFSWRLPWKSHN